jgi:hypothetical protein
LRMKWRLHNKSLREPVLPGSLEPSNKSDCSGASTEQLPRSESPPRPHKLDTSYEAASGTYHIRWHVDANQLRTTNSSVVSHAFGVSLGQHLPAVVFKLMVKPKGNGFRKSKGFGYIQLKCVSELHRDCDCDASVHFSIRMGGDARGPVWHDFSSHSIAELHKDNRLWDLRSGEDPSSKTVPICLEVQIPQPDATLPSRASAPLQSEGVAMPLSLKSATERGNDPNLASSDCVKGSPCSTLLQQQTTVEAKLSSSESGQASRPSYAMMARSAPACRGVSQHTAAAQTSTQPLTTKDDIQKQINALSATLRGPRCQKPLQRHRLK